MDTDTTITGQSDTNGTARNSTTQFYARSESRLPGVSFLLPSRGRPDKCKLAIENIRAMTTGTSQIILGVDCDDPCLPQYEAIHGLCDVYVVFSQRTPPGPACNLLAEHASRRIICPFADDMEIKTPDWVDIIERRMPSDHFWVACPWSGLSWQPTIMIFSGHVYDTIGYMFPPTIQHNYGDTWLAHILQLCSRLIHCPEIYWQHKHPFAGYPTDEIYEYQRRDGGRQIGLDMAAFDAGHAEREAKARLILTAIDQYARQRYPSIKFG